ncbi:MAG: mechanosensitive ion channel family protein [Candidatus Bathyarchaeota archaeon]|nr:mechanosensitive ion channel family protein [Candidatus Bathyarchaeota archaeon]
MAAPIKGRRRYPYKWYLIQVITVMAIIGTVAGVIYYLALTTDFVPLSLTTYVNIAILTFGGYLIIRLMSKLIMRYGEAELQTTHAFAMKNLFQISAVLALSIAVLFTLGIDVTSVLVGAGFLGIVLGLAAQTVLGNIFAGVALLGSKQFRVGDRLTINIGQYGYVPQTYMHDDLIPGYTGSVIYIGLTHTSLVGDNNVPVSYPNSVLLQSMILNHSLVKGRRVKVRLDLHRDVPVEDFKKALKEALEQEEIINTDLPIEINPMLISGDTYNVSIEAWIRGSVEEQGKAALINRAIEVVKEIRQKAGTDVYTNYPVRIGDQLLFRGEFGTVEAVTPRFTIIRIWDNRRQVVPNSTLDNEVFINYTLNDPEKLFSVVFYVPYDTNLDQAKELMIKEAQAHPDVLKTLKPIFHVLDFTQGAITIRLLFSAKDQSTAFTTACDLRYAIKKRFDTANIKLSCPSTYITPDSKLNISFPGEKTPNAKPSQD